MTKPIAPLLQGMGTHSHTVTTSSPEAQRYFDQGLVLSFGFNHKEAARSFEQGQSLDPECAMCFWGEALVPGPSINAGMDAAENPRAYAAAQQALTLAEKVTERARAYIDALTRRYAEEPHDDRGQLDQAYADAMGEVARRFPEDPDASSLYVKSLMDTTPWDYWETDGAPTGPLWPLGGTPLRAQTGPGSDLPLRNLVFRPGFGPSAQCRPPG